MWSAQQLENFRSGKVDSLNDKELNAKLAEAYHANGQNLGSYEYAKELMTRQANGEKLTGDDLKRVAALDGVIQSQIDDNKASMVSAVRGSAVGAEMLQRAGVTEDASYETVYNALTVGGKNSVINKMRHEANDQLRASIETEQKADAAYQTVSTQLSASMKTNQLSAAIDQINRQQAVNDANMDQVRRRNMSFHTKGRTMAAVDNMGDYANKLVNADGSINVDAATSGPVGDMSFDVTQRGLPMRTAAAAAHGVGTVASAAGTKLSETVGQVEVNGQTVNDYVGQVKETVSGLPSKAAWAANDVANVVQYAAGDAADRMGHAAAVVASAAIDGARAGVESAGAAYSSARNVGEGFLDAARQAVSHGVGQAAAAAWYSGTQGASAQELGHDSGSVFGQFQQSVDESRATRQAAAAQRRADADSAWEQEKNDREMQRAVDDGGDPSMFQRVKYAVKDTAAHIVRPVIDYADAHDGTTDGDRTKVMDRPWDASGPAAGSTAGYKYGRLTEEAAKGAGVDTTKFHRPRSK